MCRGAACASHIQLSFVGSGIFGCPSLFLHGYSLCLVLRWLLMIFHHFLSLVRAGSGGGRIPRPMAGFSWLVVFLVSIAIQISKSNVFHSF